jgi:integrase
MAIAIKMYEKLTQHNISKGWGSGKDDYVFFPNQSRGNALKLLQQQFTILMWKLNIGDGPRGEERTIYSLRHTCIMFRLLYGDKIDLVTLARNARTSPEMIDRHYASQLKGEDNIDMIQSRRERN